MSVFGQSQSPTDRRLSRGELLAVLGLVCAGWTLRLAGIDRVALSHFDEGVYASNYWSGPETAYSYPASHLYAPPLLPILIELLFSLLGPGNNAALLPGLVAGCLLVPLVWWMGREWFGPRAGLTACALAAFSGPHAYFSRTALTDPLLALFLTASVYTYWRAIRDRSRVALVTAVCTTGMAWWTKYNGWLPLAIVVSGTLPWLWFRRRSTTLEPAKGAVSRETASSADPQTSALSGQSARPALPAGGPQAVHPSRSTWQGLPDASGESAGSGSVSRETPASGMETVPEPGRVEEGPSDLPPVSRETGTAPWEFPRVVPSADPPVTAQSSATAGERRWSVSRETELGAPTAGALKLLIWYSLGVLACGALLVWQLQSSGGYAAVAANHRQYVVGLAGAPQAAVRQFQNLWILEQGSGRFAMALALGLALIVSLPLAHRPTATSLALLTAVAIAGTILGGFAVAGLAALLWGVWMLARGPGNERARLECWLALAWLAGLTVSTPCYTPYPRLTLPWLIVTWLCAGAVVERLLASPHGWGRDALSDAGGKTVIQWWHRPAGWVGAGLVVGAVLGVVATSRFHSLKDRDPLEVDQRGVQRAAVDVAARIRSELALPADARLDQVAVYVFGEPALFFQLRLLGVDTASPVQDLKFARVTEAPPAPVFLVAGDRTLRSPGYAAQRESAVRLRTIAELSTELPPLVWLDEPGGVLDVVRSPGARGSRNASDPETTDRREVGPQSAGQPLMRVVPFEILRLE